MKNLINITKYIYKHLFTQTDYTSVAVDATGKCYGSEEFWYYSFEDMVSWFDASDSVKHKN